MDFIYEPMKKTNEKQAVSIDLTEDYWMSDLKYE